MAHYVFATFSSGYGAAGTATASNVSVKGYGNSLLIHDKEKTYKYLYYLVLNKEIKPIEKVMFSEKIFNDYMGEEYPPNIEIFDAITVTISTDSLSKRKVIKIAESIN